MSIVNGLFSWAIQHPGHLAKVYQGTNDSRGIVLHSAEGYLPALLNLVQSFDRKASWTGSIALDGRLYQHYPVTARCWASGNALANRMYWSFELEGVRGNPANEAQVAALLRIADEFETFTGMKATRQIAGPRTLFEHNEVAQIATPNAGPTACPSGRYAPFYAALERRQQPTEEDDTLADQRLVELIVRMGATIIGDAPSDHPDVIGWYLDQFKARDTGDLEIEANANNLNAELLKLRSDFETMEYPPHDHIVEVKLT